jgi:hypothetical protein
MMQQPHWNIPWTHPPAPKIFLSGVDGYDNWSWEVRIGSGGVKEGVVILLCLSDDICLLKSAISFGVHSYDLVLGLLLCRNDWLVLMLIIHQIIPALVTIYGTTASQDATVDDL